MFHLASFLSAVAALTYQVCWLRHWSMVQGSDTYAQATVFAVLMLGFAVGSRLAGPVAERTQRPLFLYGVAELGIAATAVLAVSLVAASEPLSAWIYRSQSGHPTMLAMFRTLLGFAVLIAPTILMGATLPFLVRALSDRSGHLDRSVSSLYALNTLGAALGAGLAGFVLVASVGITRTLFTAVAINLVVGAWALIRYRLRGSEEARIRVRPDVATSTPPLPRGLLLGALALSGAVLMTFELAWTRVVALTIGGSIYSYTTVLVTVLIGLGLGNALASWRIRRGPVTTETISHTLLGLGMSGLVAFLLAGNLPLFLLGLRPLIGETLFATQVYGALLCFVLYLGPTLFCGMILPLVSAALAQKGNGVARSFASPYAINSLGAVGGSLFAGLFAIQSVGVEGLLRWTTGLVLLFAVFLIARRQGQLRMHSLVPALGLVALVAVLPSWSPQVMASGPYQYGVSHLSRYVQAAGEEDHKTLREILEQNKTLYHRDGTTSTVSVFEHPGGSRSIKVNGKADASTSADMRTQILLGVIPVLASEDPESVCVIGLGSGVTVAAAKHGGAESVDCVEIEPRMSEAASFFSDVNLSVLDQPEVQVIHGDARNHLTLTDRQYDVIISEPSNPWIAGVASLYTREFYQSCRKRLSSGGVFGQWVQLYALHERDFLLILRTLESEFPYLGLYLLTPGDSLIVASTEPIEFDAKRVESLRDLGTPAPWQDHVQLHNPYSLLEKSFVLDTHGVRDYLFGWDHANHDDHPVLEYGAPKAMQLNDWRKFCNSFYWSWIPGHTAVTLDDAAWFMEGPDLRAEQLRVARRLRDAGNYPGAAAKLGGLLSRFPDDGEVHFKLAQSLELAGDRAAAERHYESSIQRDPHWRTERARFAALTDRGRAIELYREIVQEFPDSGASWASLAELLEADGKQDAARNARERLKELDPVR